MSSNSSDQSLFMKCQFSVSSIATYTAYTVVTVLFVPLYVLVLYMGVQRWRRRRASKGQTNIFTYHIVIVEILAVVGSVMYSLGVYVYREVLMLWGVCIYCLILPGQMMFHCLTCVEYYLAVVHPITYRQRERVGFWLRHISVGCVWLVCFGWVWVSKQLFPKLPVIATFWLFGILTVVILFCCLSVLHVLTQPGPGEVGGHKERVDHSKWRAFHIILILMGALLLKIVVLVTCYALYSMPLVKTEVVCVLMDAGIWMTLPSSLVLPLLFLQRERNLPCCWQSTDST